MEISYFTSSASNLMVLLYFDELEKIDLYTQICQGKSVLLM